jgi:hypothetical protein
MEAAHSLKSRDALLGQLTIRNSMTLAELYNHAKQHQRQ